MEIPGNNSSKPVGRWVLIGLIMLFVQVILGGITRLTGSGLSITEWNIFTGTIPPLSENQWNIEFGKYRETAQYRLLNTDFSLSDFMFIYFWEWFHRLWARLVGVVFLIGFFYLLAKRKLKKEMIRPLLILFLLGALQGAVGWIMVLSGLTGDALYVKPVKLALHFVLALGLICYAWWFYLRLTMHIRRNHGTSRVRKLTWTILVLLFFQLIYGALMAGGKLANAAPTWPTINGEWIPDSLFSGQDNEPGWPGNKILIQFVHRGLAYLLLGLTLAWTILARGIKNPSRHIQQYRNLPLFNVGVQILLGIMIVLLSPEIIPNNWAAFDWFALAHQATGMLYLLVMVFMLFILQTNRQQS